TPAGDFAGGLWSDVGQPAGAGTAFRQAQGGVGYARQYGRARSAVRPSRRHPDRAIALKHDPEKCAAVFGKDHAQTTSWSGMTIQQKVIPLQRDMVWRAA